MPTLKTLIFLPVIALLSGCFGIDAEDAAIGAAAVVIADRIVENERGGDGLF